VAAAVIVAGLAVVVFQRSPELERQTTVPRPASPPSELAARAPDPPASKPVPPVTAPAPPQDATAPTGARAMADAPAGGAPVPSAPVAEQPPAAASAPARDAPAPPLGRLQESDERTSLRKERREAAPDVVLRLTVNDRAATEGELAQVVRRLGGSLTAGSASTVDIVLPREAYAALAADLARLGTLRVLRQPGELPPTVRVSLQLAS
jgi:hypothetical protein